MLSPKQSFPVLHVLPRYVPCVVLRQCPAIIFCHTPKKTHTPHVIANPSCSRLSGLVKDVSHCKNLFKKANEQLLAAAEAFFGETLKHNDLRPHLVIIFELSSE